MLRHLLHAARLQRLTPFTWSAAGCTGQLCTFSSANASQWTANPSVTVASSNLQLLNQVALSSCGRGITSKIHRTANAEGDEVLLEKHAALSESLQELGLTFSAMMAVIKHGHRHRLNLKAAQSRIQQLQDFFGPSMASDMLALSPQILGRDPNTLIANFQGMVEALNAGRPFVLDLVKRSPDLLQHRPHMVTARFDALGELLQVDNAKVLQLVRKAPVLLKLNVKKLQPLVEFMAEVAGLTPPEVHRMMLSWPVLASTNIKLIKQRYQAISDLLNVSPSEMKRIWRAFPNLLGRDPAQISQNIDALAEKLKVTREDLMQYVRKEPGLLSFNVSTLVNRLVAASQMLKLTPKLSLTLLSYHRPLLNAVSQLPQRLEALQRITGLTGDQFYSMVHKHMTVMRFPVEANEAKIACVNSLAQLYEPWAVQCQQQFVTHKLRQLQGGWAFHWRLVYLLHTGQQGSISVARVMALPHAKFREAYPDYIDWLDRYNRAVTTADIPVVGPELQSIQGDIQLSGPCIYQAVLPDAGVGRGLHAGSLYLRGKAKEGILGAAFTQQQKGSWVSSYRVKDNSISSSSDSSGSSSSESDSDTAVGDERKTVRSSRHSSGSDAGALAASVESCLPVTPAGRLAAWLGINQPAAEHLLQHHKLKEWSWSVWSTRMTAAANFFRAIAGGTASDSPDKAAEAARGSQGIAKEFCVIRSPVPGQTAQQQLQEGSPVPSDKAPRRRRQKPPEGGPQIKAQSDADVSQQLHVQLLKVQQQQHKDEFLPNPRSQQALQYAIDTGHAAAVGGVAVASHLVPLAKQLYSTPPKPPFEVVQFVFEHADMFAKEKFVQNCNALATLLSRSTALQQQLQQMNTQLLASILGCTSTRLKYVQYLVQTEQPVPWAVPIEYILLFSHNVKVRTRFTEYYPGYLEWEEFHKQNL